MHLWGAGSKENSREDLTSKSSAMEIEYLFERILITHVDTKTALLILPVLVTQFRYFETTNQKKKSFPKGFADIIRFYSRCI